MTEKIEVEKSLPKKLPTAIICDLDGCLSLFNHISKGGEKIEQYPGAHFRHAIDASNADKDLVNSAVVEIVRMAYACNYTIIFCSGRIDKFEQQTRKFLAEHLPSIQYQLFLRRDGDFRKDNVLKEEVYRAKIEPHYNVLFVLEDRSSVVAMWRSLGLVCFQVAEGDF